MLSDLITILVLIAMIVCCIFFFKTKYRTMSVFVLTLSVIPMMFGLVLNIPVIFSPFTPEMQGTVVDAETKRPLAGINIKAGWLEESASVGGSSSSYYKLVTTKTDANGKFVLPRGMKSLNKWYLFGTSNFAGVNVTIYPQNYDYKVTRINYKDKSTVTIALEHVRTDKEFLNNIFNYYYGLFLMHKGTGDEISDPDSRKWLKTSYYTFEKMYPKSNADSDYDLEKLANILETIKEPDYVYVLNKIIQKYPNSNLVWSTRKRIDLHKKNYN